MAPERGQKAAPTKNKHIKDKLSERTTYETLIAARLQQLPVPDMADSIWSAIETQLDAPGNVPGAPAHSPASNLTRSLGYAIAGLVAVTLIWWLLSHTSQPPAQPVPTRPTPETHAPLPSVPPPAAADSAAPKPPAQNKAIPVRPLEKPKDSLFHPNALQDSTRPDSAATPILHPMKVDSPVLQQDKPVLPDFDPYAIPTPSPPQGKKHKGVKGITSDDYKITASKDSTKKKN